MILLDKILYNNLNEKYYGFTAQGTGILKRATRYKDYWETHLNNSKITISNWLRDKNKIKALNILGAGSLLDVPDTAFINSQRSIFLTDANINCLSAVKTKMDTLHHCTSPIFQDISLALNSWLNLLLSLKDIHIEGFLDELKKIHKYIPAPKNAFYKTELLISLNLISQIPIHWNFAVNEIISNKYGNNTKTCFQEKINIALLPSSQHLIATHLNSLIPYKKNSSSLIITDLKYLFPDNQLLEIKIKESNSMSPKLEFVTKSKNSPITILEQDALYGFDILNWCSSLPKPIKFRCIDSWIWNLVPPNNIQEEEEIHIVSAFELDKA